MYSGLFMGGRARRAQLAIEASDGYAALLQLKYLTVALYDVGLASGQLATLEQQIVTLAAAQERAHIDFLKATLGSGAPSEPATFNFQGNTGGSGTPYDPFAGGFKRTDFFALMALFEDLGLRAIKTVMAAEFGNGAMVTTLAGMQAVDARHATAGRYFGGKSVTVSQSDIPTATTDMGSQNYFRNLAYGPKEYDRDRPSSRGEDNALQYHGAIVITNSAFDEPVDLAVVTQLLGYFAATA